MPEVAPTDPKYDSLFQLIAQRMYWFFIGPMILILLLLGIVNDEKGQRGVLTILSLIALALMIASRWYEIQSGKAVTADGQPANWGHFWKYTGITLAVGLAAIVAANLWVSYSA